MWSRDLIATLHFHLNEGVMWSSLIGRRFFLSFCMNHGCSLQELKWPGFDTADELHETCDNISSVRWRSNNAPYMMLKLHAAMWLHYDALMQSRHHELKDRNSIPQFNHNCQPHLICIRGDDLTVTPNSHFICTLSSTVFAFSDFFLLIEPFKQQNP